MKGFAFRASIPILIFSIWSSQSALGLDVSGDVWGIWSSDNNPYRVVGELRVPPGSTLVIRPGCYIDFQGHYKFIVDSTATLSAVGTESDSITFTTADTAAGWFGLRFYYADSSSELSYCVIEYGKAALEDNPMPPWPDMEGGGISCVNSDISITHCLIRNNAARHGRGGGIFIYQAAVRIADSIIRENHAGFYGGGIHSSSSDVTLNNNIIRDNIAWFPLGGDMGGGIVCSGSNASITRNIIMNNAAFTEGGGVLLLNSDASVKHNQIKNNYAPTGGGICINFQSDISLSYNLIYNNIAYYGAGLINARSHMVASNNVIAANEAFYLSPGVTTSRGVDDSLVNNIVWGNIAPVAEQISVFEETLTVIFCDVEGGWEGEGNIDADPLFRDPDNGDFHLMSTDCGDPYDSPCIDAGYPAMIDIILDCSWGLGTTVCDMGAYGGGDSSMVSVEYDHSKIPERFFLLQNYPNPFNAATTISFSLPEEGEIIISIYNILGQKVATIFEGTRQAGEHAITWDASDFPSGVYFARLETGEHSENIKMVLLR